MPSRTQDPSRFNLNIQTKFSNDKINLIHQKQKYFIVYWPRLLQNVTVFRDSAFKLVIKLKGNRVAPIQSDWCLYEKRVGYTERY